MSDSEFFNNEFWWIAEASLASSSGSPGIEVSLISNPCLACGKLFECKGPPYCKRHDCFDGNSWSKCLDGDDGPELSPWDEIVPENWVWKNWDGETTDGQDL